MVRISKPPLLYFLLIFLYLPLTSIAHVHPHPKLTNPITKIKNGLQIDPPPLPTAFPKLSNTPDETSSFLRSLNDETTLSNAGFIPLEYPHQTQLYFAQQYALKSLSISESTMLVYPYSFTFNSSEQTTTTYQKGGLFSLRPDLFPDQFSYNKFDFILTNTNVKIGKAKALYDINIAILKFEQEIDGDVMDLFYEGSSFCNYFTGYTAKYSTCLLGKEELLKVKESDSLKTGVVYLNQTHMNNNGLFSEDNTNLFGLLIIPDHSLGSEELITANYTSKVINDIQTFINNGGTVIVSGKSGYLLEKWGILSRGTYRTDKILSSNYENNAVQLTGYDDVFNKQPDDGVAFEKHLLLMNSEGKSSLISAYPMNNVSSNNFQVFASIEYNTHIQYKDAVSGIYSDLEDTDKQYLPFILYKQHNKGKIILFNGNPLLNTYFISPIFNAVLFSMSRDLIFNSYINFGGKKGLPIPGGEGGILIEAKVELLNLFDSQISNVELHVWLPNKVAYSNGQIPSSCAEDSTTLTDVTLDPNYFDLSSHIKCTLGNIAQFGQINEKFKLEIQDASVTQKGIDITVFYPVVKYTESSTNQVIILDNHGVKVEAKLGAILRGAINPDPSSMYPFPGRGYPADNVLQVENKENTIATDVIYHGVLPLVSPIVDGIHQGKIAYALDFYLDYYNELREEAKDEKQFKVPFDATGQNETLYVNRLIKKGIILAADWDQPVQITKKIDENIVSGSNTIDIININYSTSIDDPNMVLEQRCFQDSDKFFELATQRLMPFIDNTTDLGAVTSGVDEPDEEKPSVNKKTFLFSRNDIYFYDSLGDYQMPRDIDETFVISIDKFPKSTQACADVFGFAENEVINKGAFNNEEGLRPNEWANLLFKVCNRTQYNPFNATDLAKLGPDVKLTHYLVPNLDESIKSAGSIRGFKREDGKKDGYLEMYPMVKFIYAHEGNFKINPEDSRQGGKIEFTLPHSFINGVDPIKDDLITFSADQVAFYNITELGNGKYVAYFKRGLMPNEQYGQPSNIGMSIEKLGSSDSFTIELKMYEVKYDVSANETEFEYYKSTPVIYSVTFNYNSFFSFPAIEISAHMNRENSTEIKEYELLMPYTRYGVYQQELIAHRTVYAYLEAHNVNDPGIVSRSSTLSTISNVGISSIPTVEYVTHGEALLIPYAARTSRIEWRDIWGRKWNQPLRSVFPDIPPIPPPLKNFMMSTTFEIFDAEGKERLLEWPADEEAYVHIQVKFLNNFPKFFLSTNCKDNCYPYMKNSEYTFQNDRVFTKTPYFDVIEPGEAEYSRNDGYVSFGFSSVYGKCYQKQGAILSGKVLEQSDFDLMDYAMVCGSSEDSAVFEECLKNLENISTLKRRPTGDTTDNTYNYSPSVEKFYPEGYIKGNMWDLTHYDYDDNAMDKAYRYHCDNNLPSLDVCPPQNPAYLQPHNTVSFPLFKGFGYDLSYSKDYTLERFGDYKGWWSDNLQNKDNTLLAGQSKSNDVSVGKETLLPDDKWINYRQMNDPHGVTKQRLKNVYACLFNQHRIKISPSQSIYAFPENVYQNNIIPILTTEGLAGSDALTSFNCSDDIYQYSPKNISLVDNIVQTVSDRDWMYFGVNLRGGARENINFIMKLKPLQDSKFEGTTKVQDGGRFVYWNPVNGPNSFLIVDNVVNTVESSRVDLSVVSEVFPSTITTFNAELYQLYTIEDKNEYLREYTEKTYINSYGFGDAGATVYVGGTEDTSCKLSPGETTYVKITLYNNAGFDWNMKAGAIDFEVLGDMAISANDLLMGLVHSIQRPLSYNFLKINIPAELEGYVHIIPSDHNIQTAPQFFDFENINIVTIRDGFEGNYFLKLTIDESFPDELKGKLHSIQLSIDESYFDNLPGPNDPTHIHDYTLQIPSIKFGVVYPHDHVNEKLRGKVFYTLGRATNIKVQSQINKALQVTQVRFVTPEIINAFREATSDPAETNAKLQQLWNNNVTSTQSSIPFKVITQGNEMYLECDFANTIYSKFPKENKGEPDTTTFYFMAKLSAPQINSGYSVMLDYAYVTYKDWRNKQLTVYEEEPMKKYASAKGAWLQLMYAYQVVTLNENGEYVVAIDQRVYEGDTGIVQVNVTAKNVGDSISYYTKFQVDYANGVEFLENNFNPNYHYTVVDKTLQLNSNTRIAPGESYTETLYFEFSPLSNANRYLSSTDGRTIINRIIANIDQTEIEGYSSVMQVIDSTFVIYYPQEEKVPLDVGVLNKGNFTHPVLDITITTTSTDYPNAKYSLYRMTRNIDAGMKSLLDKATTNVYEDQPLTSQQTANINSYGVLYRAEMYDENDKYVTSLTVEYVANTNKDIDEVGSDNNKPNDLWIPIVAAFAGAIVIGVLVFIIYRCVRSKKNDNVVNKNFPEEKPIRNANGQKRIQFNHNTNNDCISVDNTKRPALKGEEIRVHKFKTTFDFDY